VGKNLLNLFFFSKLFRSHTVPVWFSLLKLKMDEITKVEQL
jgi:hypothetical protein